MKAVLLTSLSALVLCACAAGPKYVAPIAPPSATAPFITANAATVTTPADQNWWRLYRDPALDALVADALAANTDLRVAVARLDAAKASLRGARSDRLPQVTAGASGTYGRLPQSQRLPGSNREAAVFDTGLDVSYEVDLAGRVRRNIEAARGDVAASAADADAVRVSIVAATTRAYVDAAAAAERQAVAERIVALLSKSAELTGKRVDAGRATKFDYVRIATLRDQRAALVPAIIAERQAALFRLATLTGRTPQELPAAASARTTTPRLDQPIPVGDGAGLLARRPDVRAAERRLAAATARIGVATADLYPHITLGGSGGVTGPSLDDLFTGGPVRWLVGPLLNWSLNQSAARAKIAGAQADTRGALASFDGSVLTALEETETALSTYARELDRRAQLQSARDNAETAARITRARQREGTIDFLEVLDAERTFADADADVAAADARIADAQIDLFRALGGGWQARVS
ncbi:NodT family efflux transporter outer membrane factor (OMF) lipoprotein [Sphingomonas sp. BE270]|jgi:NodT family efflux transporter outer membrane factor (OMF) lipoprotein|uniref:efflux transporter outer membrane subunit n=1 Tax=unclassified Sphingomonas TaxID=196159 RepID=UPI0010F98A88|nr:MULTISPECIES: efflux transporter outer membrane subunit [unclassified Sphingomonas]MDR6849761.1 NodT family efflux transporter outer membrane factor (OMF) lipoprotein [Sphingomonas sp. BE137]MDR7257262.1 NodT family efflux transporter outer membrane factor (OMF) lipoprotein [Sphingomonas sp. BE270]